MIRDFLWKLAYLKTSYIFIAVLIFFFALAFNTPALSGRFEDVSTIFTVSSFLYGVLSAWIISTLWSRLESIKQRIAAETGTLESIYKFSSAFGKSFSKKVSDVIDDYIVEAFEYELHEYHIKTEKYFLKIFDVIKTVKPKTDVQRAAVDNLFDDVDSLTKSRNEIIPIASNKLEVHVWIVLVFLSFTIIYSLFYIKTAETFSVFFTALISSTVILLLLVIRDLNELKVGEEIVGYEMFERVLDVMGKPRYYPEESFIKGRIKPPPPGFSYRVGHVPKAGEKHRRRIKFVENK